MPIRPGRGVSPPAGVKKRNQQVIAANALVSVIFESVRV